MAFGSPWNAPDATWRLAAPFGLLLLVFLPLPIMRQRSRPRIAWPSFDGFPKRPRGRAGLIRHLPIVLEMLTIVCLGLALSRPQSVGGTTRIRARAVAIVVALDRSSTMTTADFRSESGPISRLDAARTTFERFVEARPDDLIGLIPFAAQPVRASPPTLDHNFLLDAARAVRPARGAGEDGTDLGRAIVLGLGDLRASSPKKKVLILLTDGRHSPAKIAGETPIEPEEAAQVAHDLGITLHTIAVGGPSQAGDPRRGTVVDPGPDLDRLRALAQIGGGESFSASDTGGLAEVFAAIDRLEKSPVAGEVRVRYRELYGPWVASAMILIAFDIVVKVGILRRSP